MAKTQRLSIRISNEFKELLLQLAKEDFRTLSSLVEKILINYVEDYKILHKKK